MKETIKGVCLNDLHFGIPDSKRIYEELIQVKDFLNSHELNVLFINGDYFHCKLSVGDSATYYAMLFFSELVKICKEKQLKFRIIQGTRFHDLNQLQLFKPYENDLELDFKIIESVSDEEIFEGFNVLYLPEEYPENADEYYKEYKAKQYEIICAHGTFDFVALPGQIENAERSTHSAPVFIWKEWKDTVPNGFVSAGHIHGRNTYGKKIYYSGSFSRWNYGERSEKGFTYFEYNLTNKEYTVNFIDNTMAPKYDVISVKELGVDLNSLSAVDIKTILDHYITEGNNLRIDLTGLSDDKAKILKEVYEKQANIKIEYTENKTILKESKKNADEFSKWHYITKRQLPLNKTVKKYCKEELGEDIDIGVIDNAFKEE